MGFFLAQWIEFERLVRRIAPESEQLRVIMPSSHLLARLGLLDQESRADVERIRRLRNNLVHGIEVPEPADLWEAARRLQNILARLAGESNGAI
jgi:hypothetical protein